VSLTVDGELAEAVAELMGRYITSGIVVESGIRFVNSDDEGTPSGPVAVYGYLPVDENLEVTKTRIEEGLWHLGTIKALPALEYVPILDEDWMAAWKKHYHPIRIGKRILILPAWLKEPAGSAVIVRIDPSMAFGTGTHPTTQLCMEMMDSIPMEGKDVIDIGCGSGILSITALKLGAKQALAIDIDPLSIKATIENAQLNSLEDKIEVGLGSVSEVVKGSFSIKRAPVILVNILAPVIIRLFEDGLGELTEPGGYLILSGIIRDQVDSVTNCIKKESLSVESLHYQTDWACLLVKRPV
jgi:ribosomal protein L11 methyltransferase